MVEESRARPPNSTKVFVGNLSATCSADDLHGLFSTFGRVLDCDKVKGELVGLPVLMVHIYADIFIKSQMVVETSWFVQISSDYGVHFSESTTAS